MFVESQGFLFFEPSLRSLLWFECTVQCALTMKV